MAQGLSPPSSDCTAVPGCMTRQSKNWSMTLSPGAMSPCSSTAMLRVVSITPAHQTPLPRSSCAGRMPSGLRLLARQTFVSRQRVAAVGFSAGAWVALSVTEPNSFEPFIHPSNLRFRAAAAFNPPCKRAVARPEIPTLIFIGTLDDWTPAADCSDKIARWGKVGPPVELVIYPGAYHGFDHPHLQPGTTLFGHWVEYNGEAADNASHRLHQFLDRHLN